MTKSNATTTINPINEGDTIIVKGDFVINVYYAGWTDIVAYIGNGGDIAIPDGINGIHCFAFEENGDDITSIHLPDSVEWIDEYAFCGCTHLTTINLPESLQNIGMGAFKDCKSLKSITIPHSVKVLDYALFEGCTSLEYVKLPDGVEDVPDGLFKDCPSLTKVEMPDSVKHIDNTIVDGCVSLVSRRLTLIRHTATSTMKWHNMTVKHGHYYGYLKIGNSTTPVFWSGWVSDSDIYLYNAITCMAEWVDNDALHNPEIYILGEEPYVDEYDDALYEWETDSCGYRPNEGDYLPFWVYDIYRGWNPLYM